MNPAVIDDLWYVIEDKPAGEGPYVRQEKSGYQKCPGPSDGNVGDLGRSGNRRGDGDEPLPTSAVARAPVSRV